MKRLLFKVFFVLFLIFVVCIIYFSTHNAPTLKNNYYSYPGNVSTIESKIPVKYKNIFMQIYDRLKSEHPFNKNMLDPYSIIVDSNNEVIGFSFDVVASPKIDDLILLMQVKSLKYIEIHMPNFKIEDLEQFYKYKDKIKIYYYLEAHNELQGKLIEKPFIDGFKVRSMNKGDLPEIYSH